MGRWRLLRTLVCALVGIYLVAPLVVVLIISFSSASFLRFPPPGYSLRWYENLVRDPAWMDAVWVSIQVLVPTALLSTALGTAAALALIRGRLPGAGFVGAALMAPLVVPSIITSAGLYIAYRGFGLNGTLTGMVIGHVVVTLPYVIATVGSALRSLDPRLEAAAATLGATPAAAFRRITLPLLAPAVLSSMLFAAVLSFDELIVSLFVGSARLRTVPVQMWSNIRGDFDPTVAAIASLCFLVALIALALEALLRRRNGDRE
ncbi:ABC transporter permease [Plastoroseomonas hellenica]|uniref:ABC transporter permease n=1 Tax=Plastoroseomonas hellenica TaxID=2687306 RepID=UPI001BAA3117|nr:ABC transporter permease [Plastoroseomonas hellenica]MBR0646710.1 ABC transporter permease [Plastoroseomonas hellenica]